MKKLFKNFWSFLKKLFTKKKDSNEEKNPYKLEFSEDLVNNTFNDLIWNIVQVGPSKWNKYMGGVPEVLETKEDGKFIRFNCIQNGDSYLTSGLRSKLDYPDGKFECEARFKSGKGSWPAIWLIHPNGGRNNYESYYEIDILEYYETRDNFSLTYHYPQSMRKENKMRTLNTKLNPKEWNKFSCIWNKDEISVLFNDVEIFKVTDRDPTIFPINDDFRTFNIILSMQIANEYLSTPDFSEFPLYMDVRNIKYYKLAN